MDKLGKTNNMNSVNRYQKAFILLVVIVILSIAEPGVFFTVSNFKSILLAISIYGIMVCGTICPILLGGIDLSVGATAAMSGACVVLTTIGFGNSGRGVVLGILLGILAGVLVGTIHGIIISNFNVPPFLITLASQYIIYGVAQLLTGNQVISCTSPKMFTGIGGGRMFGVPSSVYILITMILLSYLLLNKTTFGRKIYAVGGNATASDLSGISSKKTTLAAYAISGFTAALAGIVLASMNQQAIAKAATGYESDVLTAIVVGGTSLMGGEGSLQGAVWGAFLVGIINNGLRLMGIPSTYHSLAKGLVIMLAVSVDAYAHHKNSGLNRGMFSGKTIKPRQSAH